MHDIQFKLEDVQRFQASIRTIGRDLLANQESLKKSLGEVSNYWKDDSLAIAQRDITEIDRKIREALTQIDHSLGAFIRYQVDWAKRYNSIR